jgi:hypothetical protein
METTINVIFKLEGAAGPAFAPVGFCFGWFVGYPEVTLCSLSRGPRDNPSTTGSIFRIAGRALWSVRGEFGLAIL